MATRGTSFVCAAVLALISPLSVAPAWAMSDEEHRMGGIPGMPAHILKTTVEHDGPGSRNTDVGKSGDPRKIARTVSLLLTDAPRFEIDRLTVRSGETVEFVVRNTGGQKHELVIGDRERQIEYARIVASMPDTRHEHDNVLVVGPGETRSMIWTFGSAPSLELACHADGHYQKGMAIIVSVDR